MSDNPTTPLSLDELQKAEKILDCCYAEVLRAVIKNGRVTPNRGYVGQQGLGQAPVMPGILRTISEDIASVRNRIQALTGVTVAFRDATLPLTDQLAALPSAAPAE